VTTRRAAVSGLIAACLFAASCAVNPVSGKKELSLFSEQQELALGKQTDIEVRGQYGTYADDRLTAYVAAAGKTVAAGTHRPNLPYRFAVLDSPVINAFAVPGGYIYVTRGVLALMSSEAELAVVLGHELGHVNARHGVRKMSQMILVQVGLAVGSALSDTFAKISGVAGIGVQLLFLKYSRDDEREADLLGVGYSRKAGYDPSRMVDFFMSLQKIGDLSGKGFALPGFLSTHPLTGERIRNVGGMLLASDKKLLERDVEYAGRLDGLVYGEDPRQGFVEGGGFYHPGLKFQCTFPEGWKVQNTPTQLTLASPDDDAAIVLRAEGTPEDLEAYARKKAASLEGGTFLSGQAATVHGLACLHRTYSVAQPEKEALRVRYSFIRKGESVFTFAALSTAPGFGRREADFRRIVDSFQELRDPDRLKRQPRRIRVVTADGARTLGAIFEGAGMDKDLRSRFGVMNGLALDAVPPRGRRVKIVR
jgi:predicted Zn-dependent protease